MSGIFLIGNIKMTFLSKYHIANSSAPASYLLSSQITAEYGCTLQAHTAYIARTQPEACISLYIAQHDDNLIQFICRL